MRSISHGCRRLLGRRAFLAHTVALHRQIKVIAVGIGAAGFCVWAICRPLGGSFDSAFRHAPRDLVLIIHMPSEVVEAGRLAYLAGRIETKLYATASSPLNGLIR